MKTGEKGIALIKHFEGLHDGDLSVIGLQPKKCPVGVWTVGYGSVVVMPDGTHATGEKGKVFAYAKYGAMTIEQAEELLAKDLVRFENAINKLGLPINQNQFDALVSFSYNLGFGRLLESTLLKKLKVNQTDPSIREEFEKWCKADGKVLKGLLLRRQEEADLYFS